MSREVLMEEVRSCYTLMRHAYFRAAAEFTAAAFAATTKSPGGPDPFYGSSPASGTLEMFGGLGAAPSFFSSSVVLGEKT